MITMPVYAVWMLIVIVGFIIGLVIGVMLAAGPGKWMPGDDAASKPRRMQP